MTKRLSLVAALCGLMVVTAACGTDDNTLPDAGGTPPTGSVACVNGSITGAGATFPQPIVQQWIKDFGAACPSATVSYQSVGSGAGIEQFTAGTVDFGASDAVMKPAEQQKAEAAGGTVLHVPWTAGGVALLYQLNGTKDLQLSGATLAGIYAGTITKWNAAEIKADNPNASLPDKAIQVIHRSDGSGTTAVFTSYLTAVAPTVWKAGAAKDVDWPTGQGAKGSDGVTAAVKQADGAIGYAETSYATATNLAVAKIKNEAGQYTAPTPDAVSAALKSATVPADLKVEINYKPADPAAYPISSTTWALVYAKPKDAQKAGLVKAFLRYALGPGQAAAPGLSYAPLPGELTSKALAVVETISA